MAEEFWEGNVLDYKHQTKTMNRQGQGKLTYTFSAERQQLSAFRRSPPAGNTQNVTLGRKAESGTLRRYEPLVYPNPNRQKYGHYNFNKFVRNIVNVTNQTVTIHATVLREIGSILSFVYFFGQVACWCY